jgi:uncharacterized protein YcbX
MVIKDRTDCFIGVGLSPPDCSVATEIASLFFSPPGRSIYRRASLQKTSFLALCDASTRTARWRCMHLTLTSPKSGLTARVWKTKPVEPAPPTFAVEEISAYIAIRDDLLTDAEQMRTRAKLESVLVANEFVASCLKPARAPYGAQSLAEADATRERKRCDVVRNRVAELRAQAH